MAEVEALRAAGIDAHYAYIGGYKLEAKLAGLAYAHPAIDKAQNPIAFRRSVAAIEQLIERHSIDVLHAHLTYDHWLARFAARGRRVKIVRTFHSARTLRNDPLTRLLMQRTSGVCIVNDTFAGAPLLAGNRPVFTPPPLDERLFSSTGTNARARYGIGAGERVIAVIGKLSKGRGFEDALHTCSWLRKSRSDVRLMVIGHGEHRGALETLAHELDIAQSVVWAGYHETDLAEHYRAADLLLFTAAGSDEGHRAIIEAMACGVAPVAFPIAGVAGVLGPLSQELLARDAAPSALAMLCNEALQKVDPRRTETRPFRDALGARSREFAFSPAAERLIDVYRGAGVTSDAER
ncbi:MAG: glycosyltransferase family 4 protein [Thermoanaerobaculia bacterium]|nr:glycosyltransferase family 4 protein [Thermoanaerobaculia bacterium]